MQDNNYYDYQAPSELYPIIYPSVSGIPIVYPTYSNYSDQPIPLQAYLLQPSLSNFRARTLLSENDME